MNNVVPAQLGRFFEDFEVGTTYQHPFGRTICEADSTWFTLLTCNTNQNHFNADLAQSNPITEGRIIVNSGLTVALVLGLSVIDMSQNAVANLGWTDIKLTHPRLYRGHDLRRESVLGSAGVVVATRDGHHPHEDSGFESGRRRGCFVVPLRHGSQAGQWHRTGLLSESYERPFDGVTSLDDGGYV